MERGKPLLKYALYAVIIVTAFFAHQSFDNDSKDVLDLRAAHQEFKKERTTYFNDLLALNTSHMEGKITDVVFNEKRNELLPMYLENRKETNAAFKELNQAKENQKLFHFNSAQSFFGEFWAIGLLLFCIRLVYITVNRKSNNWQGELFINASVLFCAVFYSGYLFINTQDFSKLGYITATLIASVFMIIGIYLSIKFEIFSKLRADRAILKLTSLPFKLRKHVKDDEVQEYEKEVYNTVKDI